MDWYIKHIVDTGRSAKLVALIGLVVTYDFDQVTEIFKGCWTVIRYGRPGYGLSDPLPSGQIPSIAAEVERIDQNLDALGITEPVVLAGHSLASLYVEGYARSAEPIEWPESSCSTDRT